MRSGVPSGLRGAIQLAMKVRSAALVVATLSVGAASAGAQAAKRWTPPRTPDGQADLQGIWTNATITPLERPRELGDREFLTEAEAAAFEKRTAEERIAADRNTPGEVGSHNQVWFDAGTTVVKTRRTSLVIDPPDGRVPVRPSAEVRRDYHLAHNADSPEYMSPWDRCITRGVPGSMLPAGYNNAHQIIQAPGYVVIHHEMIHDARVIPLDGRPPVSPKVRSWLGESRGRWEGDTLVVETTNFNDRGWIATSLAAGRIKGIPHSDQLSVVERFRRADADTIAYEVTIDDPPVYTRPWTVAFPLRSVPQYRIFEYACHEGNYALENILRGGRYRDAAARKP
jgi:hypothetical protein